MQKLGTICVFASVLPRLDRSNAALSEPAQDSESLATLNRRRQIRIAQPLSIFIGTLQLNVLHRLFGSSAVLPYGHNKNLLTSHPTNGPFGVLFFRGRHTCFVRQEDGVARHCDADLQADRILSGRVRPPRVRRRRRLPERRPRRPSEHSSEPPVRPRISVRKNWRA